MQLPPELKQAISQLPSAEKDKLIFRLLKHDLVLANQLLFKLVSTDSVLDRRAKMTERVKKEIERMTKTYYSPGYLLVDVRYLSGEISEHVKITKDKYGEASLNLLMLNEVLKKNNSRIAEAGLKKSYTIGIYMIARAFKILVLVKSLHEDFMIDFEEDLKTLGELIFQNEILMKMAINNGLDVNWLIKASIPDDIAEILKDVRAKGFLK